mgnify:CR=1 FL=1
MHKKDMTRRGAMKLLGGGTAVGVLSGLAVPALAKSETFELNLATVQRDSQEPYHVVQRWLAALEEQSDGAIKTRMYGGEALPGGERDALEGVRSLGVYNACQLTAAMYSTVEPKFGLTNLPFIFKDRETAFKVLDGDIGQNLDQALISTAGLRPVMRTYGLMRHVFLRDKEIQTAADFSGVKLRTVQAPIPIQAFKLMGANPVPMAAPEVYTAIQTGVVDGWEVPLDAAVAWKTPEVANHCSLTGHEFSDVVVSVSEKFYGSLPAELQTLVTETAAAMMPEHREKMGAVDEMAISELENMGMAVHEVADKSSFQSAVEPIYADFASKNGMEDAIAKIASM